jgi:putative ABC transport system substrate-binding protein
MDWILKGSNPAELPMEQPAKFELFVNLRTAQVLGLRMPDSILQQATEVIQ